MYIYVCHKVKKLLKVLLLPDTPGTVDKQISHHKQLVPLETKSTVSFS